MRTDLTVDSSKHQKSRLCLELLSELVNIEIQLEYSSVEIRYWEMELEG